LNQERNAALVEPEQPADASCHFVSFYDWLVEEGAPKRQPARQTRSSRTRRPEIYRMTRDEPRESSPPRMAYESKQWVSATLEPVPILEEIGANVASDEYVLQAQRWRDPGDNSEKRD
jgi:hypothetical protein